jgi:hypothetical protein
VANLSEQKRQQENLTQLSDEAASREHRIKMRRRLQREHDAKQRSAKLKRMAKMAIYWVIFIAAGLYALTWFSDDFVSWVHRILN